MVLARKEGNVLFNDTLNTFYLQVNGVGKEGNVLFNDTLSTFYLQLNGVGKEMFYLMTHSTHFIYS